MPAPVKSLSYASAMHDNEDGHDDDEVVRVIDVFLSPELASQLYLLQYPLEHGQADVQPTEARIKPHHSKLELSEPFPQNAELDGEFKYLERRIFESQTIPVSTHLCVGKLRESENGSALHMVPLTHIAQMRPSFRHLSEQSPEEMYDAEDEAADEKAKQNKPVAFQRKETERAASARRSSYAYLKASEDSEPWVDLDVFEEGSIEFQSVMEKVFCPATENHVIQREVLSEAIYIDSLNYIAKDEHSPSSALEALDSGLTAVVAHVTRLMMAGCPIPFSILRNRVPQQVSDDDLLEALSACSLLVRGNFCIQSKFLNLPKPMDLARDFILLLLSQEHVERSRLDRAFQEKVSSERLLSLLQQIGKLTEDGWVLKVDEDFSFQARYPNQVRHYQDVLERLEKKFYTYLKRYRSQS